MHGPFCASSLPAAPIGADVCGSQEGRRDAKSRDEHALRKTERAEGATLTEIEVPTPGEGEVLVRVHAATICGTDLHIYEWNEWAEKRISQVPMTFGHEVAGTVEVVGPEVHHLQPGTFVAAETHIGCGQCSTCRTGREHICERLRILGVDTHGAFGEYLILPARNAWPVGTGIDPDAASIMEPFGNAVHATFGTGGDEDIATNPVAVSGRTASRRRSGRSTRTDRPTRSPGSATPRDACSG